MSNLTTRWTAYTTWLQTKLPQYADLLNPGATDAELEQLKNHFGFELPDAVYELYRLNNGDNRLNSDLYVGSFMAFEFLPVSRLLETYDRWNALPEKDDPAMSQFCSSLPEGAIRKMYFNPKWIPLFADAGGNYIGVDLDPDVNGTAGQVINFGRDEDNKLQFATSLETFLDLILGEIENGNCDAAITEEDDGGYSYGLRAQSHLIDDLKSMYGKR